MPTTFIGEKWGMVILSDRQLTIDWALMHWINQLPSYRYMATNVLWPNDAIEQLGMR